MYRIIRRTESMTSIYHYGTDYLIMQIAPDWTAQAAKIAARRYHNVEHISGTIYKHNFNQLEGESIVEAVAREHSNIEHAFIRCRSEYRPRKRI